MGHTSTAWAANWAATRLATHPRAQAYIASLAPNHDSPEQRWILADNSQIPFRDIAEGSKNDLINIKDETTYEQIRRQAIERHDEVVKEQMEHKLKKANE